MASRLPVIAIVVLALLILAYSSFFVVNERQQAIVLRFGEIVDVKTEPGLYFKLPFGFAEADNVQMIEDRVMRFDLDDIRVQVSGGRFYEVDAPGRVGQRAAGRAAPAHPSRRVAASGLRPARLRGGAFRRAVVDDA